MYYNSQQHATLCSFNKNSQQPVIFDSFQKVLYCLLHRTLILLWLYPVIGLKAKERLANQEQWMSGQVSIIVATISFGMGVDKADVRYGVLLIENSVLK